MVKMHKPISESNEKVTLKSIHKGRHQKGTMQINTNLDELIDLVNLVDMGLKGEETTKSVNVKPKVYANAEKILSMSKDPSTKARAYRMIEQLNKTIVMENKKTCDTKKSELLYKRFMQEK